MPRLFQSDPYIPDVDLGDIRYLYEVESELYSRTMRDFAKAAWEQIETVDMVHDWYIDTICDHLEAIASFEIKRLVICIPPRHTKSLLCSVLFPAWVWSNNPKMKFIHSSYAHPLALRDALKTRRLLESTWYQNRWPQTRITEDQNQKERYDLTAGGFRFSTSVRGQLTGEGGDISVCDDPHNVVEGESDVTRTNTVNWWKEAMSSRMNNAEYASKLIIQQRVAEGDLAGEMIEEGYQHLILPARYEPDHPQVSIHDMRTIDGECLSQRFKENDLGQLESDLGDYAFAGQYQQRPAPRGGGEFKDNFHIIKPEHLPPKFDQIANGWDFAATEKKTADWTVRVKMGRIYDEIRGDLFYILDVQRFRASSGKLRSKIKFIVESDGELILNDMPLEPAAAGKEWAATLRMLLPGYPITFSPEQGDKVLRSQGYASAVELGNVYLVEAEWNKVFINEHIKFPAAKFDDEVDAGGRAYRRLTLGRKQKARGPANDPVKNQSTEPTTPHTLQGKQKWEKDHEEEKTAKRSRFAPRWEKVA